MERGGSRGGGVGGSFPGGDKEDNADNNMKMNDSIPLEIILIVGGAAVSFLMFILICFCTRNRIDDNIHRSNQQGHSTYVGAIGWFQRYRDSNLRKPDELSQFDNRL